MTLPSLFRSSTDIVLNLIVEKPNYALLCMRYTSQISGYHVANIFPIVSRFNSNIILYQLLVNLLTIIYRQTTYRQELLDNNGINKVLLLHGYTKQQKLITLAISQPFNTSIIRDDFLELNYSSSYFALPIR